MKSGRLVRLDSFGRNDAVNKSKGCLFAFFPILDCTEVVSRDEKRGTIKSRAAAELKMCIW